MTLSASPIVNTSGSSAGGSGLSGVSRLIGGGGSGDVASEYTKFQSLIASDLLAERLVKSGMLQLIYPNRWDSITRTWRPAPGAMESLGLKKSHTPNVSDVVKLLQYNISSDLSLKTSILTVTTKSRDPAFAVKFLTMVHRNADNILRERAWVRSKQRIDYLNKVLQQTDAVEQRQALIQLLNTEVQKQMMVASDANYAADIIDPPHVAPNPVSPKLLINIVVAIILGGGGG